MNEQGLRLDDRRGRWVLATSVLASGTALLDVTVVTVALPTIGRDLGAGVEDLQWVVSGYMLSLAALLLLGGALGDRLGRRRVLLLGVTGFAGASLLCGLAPSAPLLVAARVLQGVGAALLTPTSLALLQTTFRPEDRARAIGAWSGLTGVAAALGPLAGGLLVEVSWRLVFLVNLPPAVLVVLLARRYVPATRAPGRVPLDLRGAALAALGLGGLTYALVASGEGGRVLSVVLPGGLGLLALLALVLAERRSPAPMLPPALFASRTFTAANLVTFVVYAALGAFFFLLVQHLQVVAGFRPLPAGLALVPVTVAMLLLSPSAGALGQRVGPRLPLTAGPLLCAVGLLLLRGVGPEATYLADVLPGVTLFGLGLALTVAPLTATVLAAAPAELAGAASGVNTTVARTGGLLAVAALPSLAGLGGDDLLDAVAFADGYARAMLLAAGLLLVGALLAVTTLPRRLDRDQASA